MKKEQNKKVKKQVNKEEKIINKVISEKGINILMQSFLLIRSYSLEDVIFNWLQEKSGEDVLIDRLMKWQVNFHRVFEFDPETKKPIIYTDFIKIGDKDILVDSIFSIQKLDKYNNIDNELQFGILVNKTENYLKENANEFIVFESEEERDMQLLFLKDKLGMFKIRFN